MLINKIKIHRAMKGWTQEELAQKTGVTRQTILAIEKNKYVPSLTLALRIAQSFDKKIEDIFTLKEDKI